MHNVCQNVLWNLTEGAETISSGIEFQKLTMRKPSTLALNDVWQSLLCNFKFQVAKWPGSELARFPQFSLLFGTLSIHWHPRKILQFRTFIIVNNYIDNLTLVAKWSTTGIYSLDNWKFNKHISTDFNQCPVGRVRKEATSWFSSIRFEFHRWCGFFTLHFI